MLCQRCAGVRNARWRPIPASSAPSILTATQSKRAASSTTAVAMTGDPIALYKSLVSAGKLQSDEQQLRLLYQLRKIHSELMDYTPSYSLRYLLESARSESTSPAGGGSSTQRQQAHTRSILPSLTSKSLVRALTNEDDLSSIDSPPGFLLTGSVGTGKTMLLNIFYDSLPVAKKRVHYHSFLLGLYRKVFLALEEQRVAADEEEREMQSLARTSGHGYPWSRKEENKAKALTRGWKQVFAGGRNYDDPSLIKEYVLAKIALDLIEEATVLAFDEVQLVDIAGAGILRRVLTWYWRLGGVCIGTSNRLPSDLYQQGVQREQFQTFLEHLQTRCPVYELRSQEDWRRKRRQLGLAELSSEDETGIQAAWKSMIIGETTWYTDKSDFDKMAEAAFASSSQEAQSRTLMVYGRPLHVPQQVDGSVARFTFSQLCEKALGPADYLSITSKYPTIVISDIPQLKLTAKNEARRFITFLDAAYESRTRLICHAASEPDSIFFPDALNALTSTKEGGSEDNPLAQDMMGEVMQDLEAPFRPNISSYTGTSVQGNLEAAIKDAQTTAPAFRNLAIFTGQDEQFAYKRALSRIFELTSKEHIQTAQHAPIPDEARVWEHAKPSSMPSKPLITPVTNEPAAASETDEPSRPIVPRGTKIDPLNPQVDIADLPKPKIASTHFWGMVETYGPKAGRWGLGVKQKEKEREERLKLMKEQEAKP